MAQLLNGFWIVLQPENALMLFAGMAVGMVVGILPGISGPTAVALLIPFTFNMDPTQGILMIVALYMTATYGGSITAILFKIPGEGPAIVTTFDGYAMNKKGQAGKALGTAIFSSCLGGLVAVLVVILIAPLLASVALKFGDPEYFALATLGLTVTAGVGGGSMQRNMLSVLVGLFLSTWGLDEITGQARFTFGIEGLLMGFTLVPAFIGVFAVGEVFTQIASGIKRKGDIEFVYQEKVKLAIPSWTETLRMKWLYLRSISLGTILGVLPGVGANTAAFFAYSEAVRWSKKPGKFGTGIIDGVAAPESANNAAATGAMVPLLTLGIPGSGVTAIMIGAFMIHGIRPGPMMIFQQADLVYSIFAALFFSNLLIIIGGILSIRGLVKVLDIDYSKIGSAILLLALVGSFAIRNSMVDVWSTLCFGILSFFMQRYRFGIAPLVIAMILGPLCERSLQRAMVIADYNPFSLFMRPISGSLLVLAILSLFYPSFRDWIIKKRNANLKEG